MTGTQHSSERPTPLSELFTQYLRDQVAAHAQGLGHPESAGEVVPHEAVPVQPVDPQLAWDDALAVLHHFPSMGQDAVPEDWGALVTCQEPAVGLAFALGNFPQLVRDLYPLLSGQALATPPRPAERPLPAGSSLARWAASSREPAHLLLAAGVLRLAHHFDEAADLLRQAASAPAEWQPVRANEEAALAWHRGDAEQAAALWQCQPESVPVLFNRGVAALFLGRPAEARAALTRAVEALPETSAWHHLGQLYLTLAEMRG